MVCQGQVCLMAPWMFGEEQRKDEGRKKDGVSARGVLVRRSK